MKNNSAFFRRIVRPYSILIAAVVLVCMIMVYTVSLDKMNNESKNSAIQNADRTARQTDSLIEELNTLAEQVKRQPVIIGTFYDLLRNENEADINDFDKNVLKAVEIATSLNGLIINRAGDYSVAVMNGMGDFISSRNYLVNKDKVSEKLRGSYYEETVGILSAGEGYIVISPSKDPWTDSNQLYITFVKELKNDYSDEICGIIEVRVNAVKLSDILDGKDTVFITSRAGGNVIYPVGAELAPHRGDYVSSPVDMADWDVTVKAENYIGSVYGIRIFLMFLLIYILLLGLLFMVADHIAVSVTKPISNLAEYARRVQSPEDGMELETGGAIDEIKELEDSFGKMMTRMNNSIQQEKNAYYLALQAQMNPHFLYNMLTVIGAVSSESGCGEVTDMCVKLSAMLRYVTDYKSVTVPLKEEIAHTKNYLSLMKCRYEDYFDYDVQIDERLLCVPVPKMCVQPLAENCFTHGFSDKEPPWKISVLANGIPEKWSIVIRDNGKGISDEKIRETLANADRTLDDMSVGEIGGLGIVNTIVRLRMIYNGSVSCNIKNDGGTSIEICCVSDGEDAREMQL